VAGEARAEGMGDAPRPRGAVGDRGARAAVRLPFLELPGEQEIERPVVPVAVAGLENAPQLCLLDTGALRNVFGRWIAEAAGIELEDAPAERVAVGGVVTEARTARVDLELGGVRFDAAVAFCEPWPLPFNLLGQEAFLRRFHLELCVAEGWLELEPEPHA
jgi:hypothetical protein